MLTNLKCGRTYSLLKLKLWRDVKSGSDQLVPYMTVFLIEICDEEVTLYNRKATRSYSGPLDCCFDSSEICSGIFLSGT